ncbi:integral membrane protein-like protein [Pleomassaria siparia CBS 279.74]|uniref:Integral membrane protein-like protein n=1 Tax=Pleomassaria siparia CBS 279.74 TaxID=1314801 RepID=A0A6G1JUH1_9PLEO|nr:integral membrane protein-like protein [Pleomassaria siparia CBS 279.74]
MGKAGRFACIFVPMALTIASLLCLILVASGQLNKSNKVQRDLYFFKANTSEFVDNPRAKELLNNLNLDNNLLNALQNAQDKGNIKDFYTVGLWSYCEGDQDSDGKETITYCSERKNNFWFNPVDVWQLSNASSKAIFAKDGKMEKTLEVYHKVAGWMFSAYMIAIALTAAEFLVGIAAIFSRWGSLLTTIVSTAQSIFVFAAAITSTAIYSSMVGVFESALKPYNIHASLGKNMLTVVWLAVAFSTASGFFWTISICCCSGQSPHKKVSVEKTPYTYERVASPYLGASAGGAQQGHAMGTLPTPAHGTSGNTYEPFRHERV